jgi:hypothetical protein
MKQLATYHLTGVAPLLQHNGQLADPLNPWVKAIKRISGKSKKTEADHEEMAHLEWMGSLYLVHGAPCIPGHAVKATLLNAAKTLKKGPTVKAGLLCEGHFPLHYEGPTDPHALWEEERFRDRTMMVVNRSRVMRTRPRFFPWSAEIRIAYNDELLDQGDIEQFVTIGGHTIGLLEGRPEFGRYNSARL